MLFWSIGIVNLYSFLINVKKENHGADWAFLVCILFVLAPTWLNFSMQARGGYISAFTLSFIVLNLLGRPKRSWFVGSLTGLLFVLIFESHALWVPAIFPLFVFLIYKKQTRTFFISSLSTTVGFMGLFFLYKSTLSNYWNPSIFDFSLDRFLLNLENLFSNVFANFAGVYFLSVNRTIPIIVIAFASFFLLVITIALFDSLLKVIKRKDDYGWNLACVLAFFGTVAPTLFIANYGSRYLLPMSCVAILLVFDFCVSQSFQAVKLKRFLVFFVVVLAIPSTYQFRRAFYLVEERDNLNQNLEKMEELKINRVFTTGPLLQWQINFYSEEKIICRYKGLKDRYPKYILRINKAYENSEPTVLFGRTYRLKTKEADYTTAEGGYSFILNPTREELLQNYFEL